jgi:hypothetical protein
MGLQAFMLSMSNCISLSDALETTGCERLSPETVFDVGAVLFLQEKRITESKTVNKNLIRWF